MKYSCIYHKYKTCFSFNRAGTADSKVMRLSALLFVFAIMLSFKTNDSLGLKKMSTNERNDYIASNIKARNGTDLGNFIYHIQESKIDLEPFHAPLTDKLLSSNYPYDIYILTNLLVNNKEYQTEIEQALTSKIKIWDTGNWSEKFWSLIKEYHLNIERPGFSAMENNSLKKYNVEAFMKTKIENDELGKEPLLMVNWSIISYEEGTLIETLHKLNIKHIDYTPKSQSVSLYGKRGIDGVLNITTY